jgi:hypothetical protein
MADLGPIRGRSPGHLYMNSEQAGRGGPDNDARNDIHFLDVRRVR